MQRRTQPLATVEGTNNGDFAPLDWGLLAAVSLIWGSSFLWIAIGLDSLSPASVAFLRLALGGVALALFPSARLPVDRGAWPAIAVVALTANAAPALLFALAQQRVDSSAAGMLNAATPLAVMLFSIALAGTLPPRPRVEGLVIGFVGVAVMAVPNLVGVDAEPLGLAMLLLAISGYGIGNNTIVGLQQVYGSAAIVMRSLLLGALLLAPWGVPDTLGADPTVASVAAVIILGVAGTGFARALAATLAGRTGASRAALVTYFIPIVAIVLGTVFRHESVGWFGLAGTALILLGARRASRGDRR